MDTAVFLLLIVDLIFLIAIFFNTRNSRKMSGGCNVKPPTDTPRPNVMPAPQSPQRNKFGRTPDEQELHEYMEDNPR